MNGREGDTDTIGMTSRRYKSGKLRAIIITWSSEMGYSRKRLSLPSRMLNYKQNTILKAPAFSAHIFQLLELLALVSHESSVRHKEDDLRRRGCLDEEVGIW